MSSNNEEQEGNEACEDKSEKVTKQKERNRSKFDRKKVKGKVEEDKEDGVVRLFSVNCNGLRPRAASKIDQTMDSSERRKTDGLMTSSSDIRWSEHDENKMTCELKNMNKNVMLNASDGGEKVNDGRWFLKGGTAAVV